MISNTKCKQILNKNGIKYSDKEVEILKDVLYRIAHLVYIKNNKNI